MMTTPTSPGQASRGCSQLARMHDMTRFLAQHATQDPGARKAVKCTATTSQSQGIRHPAFTGAIRIYTPQALVT